MFLCVRACVRECVCEGVTFALERRAGASVCQAHHLHFCFLSIHCTFEQPLVVLEAAILLEAGWRDLVDEVWVKGVEPETAVQRLIDRNGLKEEQAMARINSQVHRTHTAMHIRSMHNAQE